MKFIFYTYKFGKNIDATRNPARENLSSCEKNPTSSNPLLTYRDSEVHFMI